MYYFVVEDAHVAPRECDGSRKTDMTKARASKVEVKYFGKPACWEVAKEMLMNDVRMLLILLIYNQI